MDPQFWLDAGRDLVLLVAGAGFTLLGAWLANRNSRRESLVAWQRSERTRDRDQYVLDAGAATDAANAERVLATATRLRAFIDSNAPIDSVAGYDLPQDLTLAGIEAGLLIRDTEARQAITAAFELLDAYSLLVPQGRGFDLAESVSQHQWRTVNVLRSVAAAIARGESTPDEEAAWLKQNAAEIDVAFEQAFSIDHALIRDAVRTQLGLKDQPTD